MLAVQQKITILVRNAISRRLVRGLAADVPASCASANPAPVPAMDAMTPTARRQPHSPIAPKAGERDAFVDAARHSRMVRRLKRGLPLGAAGLVILFFGWSWATRQPLPLEVHVDDSAIADGKLVMVNPQLGGVNKDNERYTMSAARAVQEIAKGDVIHLETIEADVPVKRGNRARIIAESGIYDRGAGTMVIETPVTATTTDGTTARLGNAHVDLNSGKLVTDLPVDITMSGAHITAESMSIADNGKTIVFDRRVRLTVDPAKAKTPSGEGTSNGQN